MLYKRYWYLKKYIPNFLRITICTIFLSYMRKYSKNELLPLFRTNSEIWILVPSKISIWVYENKSWFNTVTYLYINVVRVEQLVACWAHAPKVLYVGSKPLGEQGSACLRFYRSEWQDHFLFNLFSGFYWMVYGFKWISRSCWCKSLQISFTFDDCFWSLQFFSSIFTVF